MTREQIEQIIKSGGDRLEKLNREVPQELDNMDLSDQAREMIAIKASFTGCFFIAYINYYCNNNALIL